MEKKYIFVLSVILSLGLIVCFLATIGYNFYISISKGKVEAYTTMNSSNLNTLEEK